MIKRQPLVKDELMELGVRPTKVRGQNFLKNPEVIENILSFASPSREAHVVEIGPGLGALTDRLVALSAKSLTLVEIEPAFCDKLKDQYGDKVNIINEDVRTLDLSTIGKNLVVFGNLPYSLSTEILFHVISYSDNIDRAIFMLQREFAERIASKPGSKAYGTISVNTQVVADVKLGPIISGDSFHPPTQVQSRLIELHFPDPPKFGLERAERISLSRVVRAAFAQRRKKLSNSLKASGLVPGQAVSKALLDSGIDGSRRAETLSIEEFLALSRSFGS